MKNRKGFTLTEMLIVMAVTVIFAAAAIPALSNGPLEAARNKEREVRISAAISDAYADAVLQGTEEPILLPDAVLKDIAAHVETEGVSISFGDKTIPVSSVPENAASVKCSFTKVSIGVYQLASLTFYDNSDAPIGDPIPAT